MNTDTCPETDARKDPSMREGERLLRRIEQESRGVLLEREDISRIVAALLPCIATRPIELALTDAARG